MGFGKALTAGVLAATVASEASALTFGIFQHDSEASYAGVSGIVTAQGHVAKELDNLGDLGGIDVLWILSGDNDGQPPAAALSTFVAAGGILLFHDRNVASAESTLPGDDGIVFVRGDQIVEDLPDTFNDYYSIQIVTDGTLVTNGPGGVLTDASLDFGESSSHGYAAVPPEVTIILSRTNPAEAVDFTYAFGDGAVYYSTMPLDYYLHLAETNPADPDLVTLPARYASVYAPNVVAYAASLVPVSEPAAVLVVGVGLLGLAAARRRR